MKNFMFYLSILMISNIYAESITIYATQSASYRASGSGSSGCCALNSIGYNNSNTLSASSCIWWSQYGQCERRTSYPVWSFNFLQLPSNATVVSVSFDAEGLYDEWHDSYMALSSETGEITIQMGSYLVNGGDWSIDGQTWTWWNQGLNINQELPVSEVELGIDSGQLNVAVHEYDATIINSGLNAPRLVIEYELLDYECSEMNESACSNDTNCNWIENIEIGNCDWLSTSECVSNPECLLDCVTTYDCFGCTGGWYEIDNGFCEEVSFIPGDVNGDGSLNISDIVLMVDLILSLEYDMYSDMNQDGILNVMDVVELVSTILGN